MTSRRFPFFGVLAAGAFSRLANAVAAIAYPWLALDLGGPAFAGLVAATLLAPLALGHVLAGVLVERFGVRLVAVVGEAASAASALILATFATLGMLAPWSFALLVFAGAALDGPARVANQARWPEIARLARQKLSRATALDASTDHAATLLGPTLAGLIIAGFGAGAALWLVTGLAAMGFLLTLAALPPFRAGGGTAATFQGIAEGVRCIMTTPVLASVCAVGAVAVAAFSALESVVLPATAKATSEGALALTAYLSSAGLGALVGSLGMAFLRQTPRLGPLFALTLCGMAGGVALLAAPASLVLFAGAGALIGLSYGALGPALNAVFLSEPPQRLRAHVNGASSALTLVLAPFAAACAGLAFQQFGAAPVILALAGVLAALAPASLATPQPKRG
jgi:macrolide resistance protein